jgi:hypothetical protein
MFRQEPKAQYFCDFVSIRRVREKVKQFKIKTYPDPITNYIEVEMFNTYQDNFTEDYMYLTRRSDGRGFKVFISKMKPGDYRVKNYRMIYKEMYI